MCKAYYIFRRGVHKEEFNPFTKTTEVIDMPARWEPVKGARKVVLAGYEDFEFFSVKGHYWSIREASTGMSVLRGCDCFKTLKEAKVKAIERLQQLEGKEPLGVMIARVRAVIVEELSGIPTEQAGK